MRIVSWYRLRFVVAVLGLVVACLGEETPGERDVERVRRKAAEADMKYTVAVDNDSRNWDAWANHVWPSVYLIDKKGFVRYWWYGELNWQGTPGENWARGRLIALLAEPHERALAHP